MCCCQCEREREGLHTMNKTEKEKKFRDEVNAWANLVISTFCLSLQNRLLSHTYTHARTNNFIYPQATHTHMCVCDMIALGGREIGVRVLSDE